MAAKKKPANAHFEGLKLGPQLGAYSLKRTFPASDMLAALDAASGDPRAKGRVSDLLTGKDDD